VLDTSGPVGRPDETQDETYTISNSDSGFTSNSWYTTGNLSADRSVSFGELLAVVLEYGTYGGTDSVQISSVSLNGVKGLSHTTLKTGGSWSAVGSVTPNVLLEFSDGTFGTLKGAVPASGFTSFTYKQDTGTADEHALQFQVPFPCKIDGAGAVLSISAGTSNFDFVVYDGTTEMTGGTVSVDANTVRDTSVRHCDVLFSQAIQLEANHDYYLSIKPTQTSNTVTLYVIDVNASGHFQAHPMGETWKYTSRLDLGSWASATNTRRPLMGLWMCAFDDAAGAPVTGYMGMP
jgi:hypothetical protein